MLEDLPLLSKGILSSFEVFTEEELRISLFCDMMCVCGKLDRELPGQHTGLLYEGRAIKEEIVDILLLNAWNLRYLEKPGSDYAVTHVISKNNGILRIYVGFTIKIT
jgi:hypothetical protein